MHTQVRVSASAGPAGDMNIPKDLASAYIISPVSRPDLALHHLQHVTHHNYHIRALTIVFQYSGFTLTGRP